MGLIVWNKIVFGVESFLRRSWLARILPFIREQSPELHRAIIRTRDRLFPYESAIPMERYQYRALHHFLELASQEDALNTVLEIGSDLSGAVSQEMIAHGARMVIGVNPLLGVGESALSAPLEGSIHLLRSDARLLPLQDESISSIFSVATFEHIYDLDIAMGEMLRVLQPGGLLFSDFGPIWSCSIGHHVYAKVGDEEARHWKPGKNPVPNFGHLLFSADALCTQLEGKVSRPLLDAIIAWIYEQDGINRLFYEDYIRVFEHSGFQSVKLNKVLERIDPAVEKKLKQIYAPYQEFRCRMIEVVLRKPISR
jgi:SAM-dependent methyltransferase